MIVMKTSKKTCLIITAYIEGTIRDILDPAEIDGSFVICADAGYARAVSENIRPDLIMGDFDSLSIDLPDDIPTVTFPSRKDYTDTGLALKYALDHGYTQVIISGGIGGRLDHTLSNIQDIAGFTEKGLDITMKDDKNIFTVLKEGEHHIPAQGDSHLSVFAYTEEACVSISGVSYPLDRHTLTTTYPLGVSNEFTDKEAVLTVHSGTVMMMLCK